MLCIVYISKAKTNSERTLLSDFIADILPVARQRNRKSGITSAIVFRQGMILQLLEGNTKEVDKLYKSISNDSRHENIEKVIDIPISNRMFRESDIQLLLNIREDRRFVNFLAVNKEILLSLDENIMRKLKCFGCDDLTSFVPEYDEFFYSDKCFMLKVHVELDWFEIGMLDPEIAMAGILLSEKLLHKRYTFKELLESAEFGSAQRLIELLNTLNTTGKLLMAKDSSNRNLQMKGGEDRVILNSEDRNLSFGQKVLSWLKKH